MSRRTERYGPGWLVWLVSTPVVASAVVLSFAGLTALARACQIDGWLAYLWPVSVDATGIAATLIWLNHHRAPADARRAARWLALSAIGLSIGGNSLQHWLVAGGHQPHVLVQMAVGAVPPMVLAAMLHVLQLATRRPASQPATRPARLVVAASQPASAPGTAWLSRLVVTTTPAGHPSAVLTMPAPAIAGQPVDPIDQPVSHPDSQPARVLADRLAVVTQIRRRPARTRPASGAWMEHLDQAREVVATEPGIGRPALAKALGVPTSQARKLLDHIANQPAATAGDDQKETSHAAL